VTPYRAQLFLWWLLSGLLPCAAGGQAQDSRPATVELPAGQTIEQLAEKYFGDAAVADEIRALNRLPPAAQPRPGTNLRLPGSRRDQVVTMLQVAAQALASARSAEAEKFAPEKFSRADTTLQRARQALSRARYDDCRQLADEAWALAKLARKQSLARRPRQNRFSVSVDKDGTTRVSVSRGDGVKVTAGKKSTTVKPGQAVRVTTGAPPEEPRTLLPPPQPALPNHGATLLTPVIYFRWQAVAGASRYVLLIARDRRGRQPVRQITTAKTSYLFRSTLPVGSYWWMLRSVDSAGLVGTTSAARSFSMRPDSDGGTPLHQGHNNTEGKIQ